MTKCQLDKVIQEVESPLVLNSTKVEDRVYDFELQGKGRCWNVRVDCSYGFPFKLPTATLLNKEVIGSIPHVNFEGLICVEENDTILIDYNRPIDLMSYFLTEVAQLLNRACLKIFQDELTDEYEGYFQSSISSINSFYFANDIAEVINLRIAYRNNYRMRFAEPILLYGNNPSLPRPYSNISEMQCQCINIIHVPLSKSVLPPSANSPITSEYIFHIFKNVSDLNQVRLKKLLHGEKSKKQFFVLFSMPRKSGERSQLLIRFTIKQQSNHPLVQLSGEWTTKVYLLNRNNKSYLLERGGAENALTSKKVVVIGCGSVGSEITLMLAKAGVGELMLIDYDALEPDNIYRHRLGGSSLNYIPEKSSTVVKINYKVTALASLLTRDFPYIKVNVKPKTYKKLIKDTDFINADIIVVAVGAPSVSLQINKTLKENNFKKVVFCWNEAAGLGGHSVSLDLTESCLECLYSNQISFSMSCYLSLLEPGQNISKNLTGCAGVFTPFSYLDSSQTAVIAAKQCINMLLYNEKSIASSWKGENKSNLKVTPRYHSMSLNESIKLTNQCGCKVCNG
ncbi:MAG: ThiF family adenylyltransferase [Gammaproteobacteria bacterium]|nr:ThiF family adenylyltransferase [Gammaproteobacteria bacterium]